MSGRSVRTQGTWMRQRPLLASVMIAVFTGGALQLTHVIDFQVRVAEVIGWTLSVRFIDFAFRTVLGALVVFVVLPWAFGHLRQSRWLADHLREMRFATGCAPGRTMAASALSASIMLTLLVGLAVRFDVLGGDFEFLVEGGRWFVVILALVPGIWEELAFRGLMLTTLQRRYHPWIAILVSAVMFGLFHITNLLLREPADVIFEMIMATGMGIAWGYVVVRTESVLPAMALHYLVNVAIELLIDPALGETAGAVIFGSLTFAYPALTIAAVWLLYRGGAGGKEEQDRTTASAREPIAT